MGDGPRGGDESLGVWAADRLAGQLGYSDPRGMPVSETTQQIAAAKNVIEFGWGLPRVAHAIQRPFDVLEGHANQNPGGMIDRLGPPLLNTLGLLSEGFVRVVGRGGLIEQMYPQTIEGSPPMSEHAPS